MRLLAAIALLATGGTAAAHQPDVAETPLRVEQVAPGIAALFGAAAISASATARTATSSSTTSSPP